MFTSILFEQRQSIATITLNRPEKLNALSEAVFIELKHVFSQLKKDSSVGGLILTGAGEKAFVAGADIKGMNQMTPAEGEKFAQFGQEITEMLESLPFPVIACVNGFALGGGCELALSADFIYCTKGAVFGQPEVNLGLIPGFGGCVRLIRYVGPGRAKELIYTGKHIGAGEAKSIGLVNAVFETRAEMLAAAEDSLRLIATKSKHAVEICKTVIGGIHGLSTADALLLERAGFRKAFEHEEKVEGVSAFLEKRKPNFCQVS
jgi:enoyl-CoA hydratase